MERSKDHSAVARTTVSGTDIDIGTYDSRSSSAPSVWVQTEDNPEPIYMKTAEAKLLIAALTAAVDYIEQGD